MKYIPKIFYIFINLFFITIIFYYIIHKNILQSNIIETTKTWLYYVLPSISISYICSIFLIHYPFISRLIFPILSPIFHFENSKSCSIFLISIIVGNPTAITLIIAAQENNEISLHEANRLISFTNFISSIFIFSMFSINISIFILVIELLSSTLIANHTTKHNSKCNLESNQKSILDIYFNIINTLPSLLLSILCSMIFCTIISFIIKFEHLKVFLEITNGIMFINTMNDSFIKFLLLIILITSNGLAIILQSYFVIKKSNLSFSKFIKYHFISVLISMTSLILIYFIYTFLSTLH